MVSVQSLREQLNRYANGEIDAETFEAWLAGESWDMRRWVPVGLQRLVEALQVAFIDYSDGRLSEDSLRDVLIARRNQLQRALEATQAIREQRGRAEFIHHYQEVETAAVNESAIAEPVSA